MSGGAEASELEVAGRSTANAMPEAEAREGYKWVQLGPKSIEIPEKWELRRFEALTESSGRYGANASAQDFDPEQPRYIRITDISDHGSLKDDDARSLPLQDCESYLLEPGQLLFARTGATVGKTYLYRETDSRAAYAGYLIMFQPDTQKADPEFLFHFTQSKLYDDWVAMMTRHGAQQNVNASEYASMGLPTPPLPEQRRIAAVLSTVDEEIRQTEAIIETTEELKRGLMQNLLIRGVGHDEYEQAHLGPRELTIPTEWERVRMRNVTELIRRGKQPTYVEEPGVPVLNQSCIYWDGFHPEELRYLDEGVADSWKGKYFVETGDVLINSTGRGTLGRALHWSGPSDEYALDGHITRVKTKRDEIDPRYLRYYLESTHGQTMLHAFCVAGSTGQTELSKGDLLTMPLLKPPIEEQRRIADVLIQVTRKIRDEREHNTELQDLKCGLMQDLLTGTVRIPESIEVEN